MKKRAAAMPAGDPGLYASSRASRAVLLTVVAAVAAAVMFVADMCVGARELSIAKVWNALWGRGEALDVAIVRDIRLLKALTAVFAGAALSVSGQQMQTLFHNPLAGPYVLGVTSGASLGVALAVLGAPLIGVSMMASLGLAGAAWVGAVAVLALMALASARLKNIMAVLILGIMLGSGVSAIVQILQFLSREDALKSFVVWTMGSLADVTASQVALLGAAVAGGLVLAVAAVKPLNLLQMGEQYALTMGLPLQRARMLVFASTSLLAGTVTAFCGPIGFVGLAVPHITRLLLGSADHRRLLPANVMIGAVVMLACDMASTAMRLPVNTVTALIGVPVVVWLVTRRNFNSRG